MEKIDKYETKVGDTLLVFRKAENDQLRIEMYGPGMPEGEDPVEPSMRMAVMLMTVMKNCPEFQTDLAKYIYDNLVSCGPAESFEEVLNQASDKVTVH